MCLFYERLDRRTFRAPDPPRPGTTSIELSEREFDDLLDGIDVIGTDVREVLERRPASSVVVRLIYKKFVRKDRTPDAPTEVLSPETVELPAHAVTPPRGAGYERVSVP